MMIDDEDDGEDDDDDANLHTNTDDWWSLIVVRDCCCEMPGNCYSKFIFLRFEPWWMSICNCIRTLLRLLSIFSADHQKGVVVNNNAVASSQIICYLSGIIYLSHMLQTDRNEYNTYTIIFHDIHTTQHYVIYHIKKPQSFRRENPSIKQIFPCVHYRTRSTTAASTLLSISIPLPSGVASSQPAPLNIGQSQCCHERCCLVLPVLGHYYANDACTWSTKKGVVAIVTWEGRLPWFK